MACALSVHRSRSALQRSRDAITRDFVPCVKCFTLAYQDNAEAEPCPHPKRRQGFRSFLLDSKQEALPTWAVGKGPASLLLATGFGLPSSPRRSCTALLALH